MIRSGVGAAVAVMAVTAMGCGSSSDKGSIGKAGRDSPSTAGVVLTVLNYGRTASAKEVCPLLSKAFVNRITGGKPTKCATAGARILCPCTSEALGVSRVSLNGNKATAVATRPNGKTVTLTLVQEGPEWKIDSLDRQA